MQYPNISDIHITVNGIYKILSNQHCIHQKVPKQLATSVAPILKIIVQKPLEASHVPSDWKKANVCPYFVKERDINLQITDQYH